MSEPARLTEGPAVSSVPTPQGDHDQPHIESHFESSATVRDIVIGLSDGLTVPFALAAGLSGAVASSRIVVLAGLAEIAAGSIAMGLGGYLAARGDSEHYVSEKNAKSARLSKEPRMKRRRSTRSSSNTRFRVPMQLLCFRLSNRIPGPGSIS